MGTATNDSDQTSPSDAVTSSATEMSQPRYKPVITEQLRIVNTPTSEERYDDDAQNKPRSASGRHLGRPSIMQKLFGWMI